MFRYVVGLPFQPRSQWQALSNRYPSIAMALLYPLVMAALPAIAWYFGVTRAGWRLGGGNTVRLTTESAMVIVLLFYITQVLAVIGIGLMVHWMARTYVAQSSAATGIALAGLAATPLFLAGLIGFYPVFWIALLLGLLAVTHSVYLLYLGLPIVMKVPEERGFLYSSAVIAVCMVCLMMIMGGSVMLWDMGAAPQFTD